nr:hypothetical protein [uncultured Cupriavidus sp.]
MRSQTKALHAVLTCTAAFMFMSASAATPSVISPPNPYLAQSFNNQTHWNDAASDSTSIAVPRGAYEMTPNAYAVVPNEGLALSAYSDRVAGTEIHWYWAGYSLRKLKVDGMKITEIDRLDMPPKLPGYQPVTAVQRLEQAAAVQKLIEAQDEQGLFDYMKSQPNRLITTTTDQMMAGAFYTLLTREDAFIGANARKVFRIEQEDPKQPLSRMRLVREAAMPATLFDNEKVKQSTRISVDTLFGMGMTFNGYLVLNTVGGKVATLRRDTLELVDTYSVEGRDEVFLNSFATGPEAGGGAVYVASNQNMYRLVVDADGKIHADEASGAWKAPYERGRRFTSVKAGDGTGSTPTLMGFGPGEDKLVVFTDGAEKMRLVAMWRDGIPDGWKRRPGALSDRVADQREVDLGAGIETVQSEQSVSVYDGHAFVVNNIPTRESPTLANEGFYVNFLNGATRPPARGAAMLRWDNHLHAWKALWTRTDVSSVSVVPMISGGSRMAIIDGYFPERRNERHLIGMDLDTGKTVMAIRTGTNPLFNGMYAPVKCDSDGRILYGMAFGLVLADTTRMTRFDLASLPGAATESKRVAGAGK